MSERPDVPAPPQSGARIAVTIVGVALGVVALASVGFVLLLVAILSPRDGEAMARGQVEGRADAIEEHLGYWYESLDAETLAAWHFTSPDADTVRPFAWTGATDAPEGADVDVIIRIRVGSSSSGGWFAPSITPGSAEGCFRYHVRNTEYVSSRRIDCPPAAAHAPTPTPAPGLPDDAEARLGDALRTADAGTLEGAVRKAFPRADVTVDTAVTSTGELVAAVGVTMRRECLVLVRHADGALERISFDRVQIEPGELGCSTWLYTRPSR
ncbi:hypothetical protein G3N30_04475 [Microbacterium lacticum]|uniref:hypothetical protein n=1 Tax=Microbacterium lacticum TaxID=33885 RepID=UPI0018B04370|nr:hypothetical protein [Microbacterium lacticum]MBF9335515.1 hypothetical protein [Microbacterium lacticum]